MTMPDLLTERREEIARIIEQSLMSPASGPVVWTAAKHDAMREQASVLTDAILALSRPDALSGGEGEGSGAVETPASVDAWATAAFGDATWASMGARANREMAELIQALADDPTHPKTGEEVADVVICLYRLVNRAGIDLGAEVDRKMAINRARRWVTDGNGHGQHVPDALSQEEIERVRGERDEARKRLNSEYHARKREEADAEFWCLLFGEALDALDGISGREIADDDELDYRDEASEAAEGLRAKFKARAASKETAA